MGRREWDGWHGTGEGWEEWGGERRGRDGMKWNRLENPREC